MAGRRGLMRTFRRTSAALVERVSRAPAKSHNGQRRASSAPGILNAFFASVPKLCGSDIVNQAIFRSNLTKAAV